MRIDRAVLSAIVVSLAAVAAGAAEAPSGAATSLERLSDEAPAATPEPAAEDGPVADPEPAADEGPVAVPEPSDRAISYYRSGNLLWWVRLTWRFFLPGAILFSGLSARMRTLARRVGRNRFFTIVVYLVLFATLSFVASLPLSFYQEYVRQHAYGLSNQSLSKWVSDSVKGLLVEIVAWSAFLWVPYLLLEKSPKRWWLWTSIAVVPFLFLLFFISPIWIDPLFNDFGPMKDREIESRIVTLAERAGIDGGQVYEVNKSVDTNAVNAYVTGLGGTKRIVVWDTLIEKLDERELLFVMAHEMGHFVLGHVPIILVAYSLLVLAALWVAHRLSRWFLVRYHERFGFDRLADVASLPLILILTSLLSFVGTPAVLAFNRHLEHEADRFGLELTRDNRAAALAFVKLQQENLGNPRPGPLFKLWRSSHPSLGERIDFCNTYRPWERGEPLVYAERFEGGP